MLTAYINAAMRRAMYEILPDDHSYYGEIPGFDGVLANASSLEECRAELMSALEDWILFRVSRHLPLPMVEGLSLAVGAPV
jgi:predicted RNase H-like HicB family nuclease